MRAGRDPVRALGRVLLAGGTARFVAGLPLPGGPGRWQRTNYRGTVVSLTSGPALAFAGVVCSGLPQPAAAVAGVGAAVLGAYDDVAGARPAEAHAKGFRGHLCALRRRQRTAGSVKALGISGAGFAAAGLLPGRPAGLDVLLRGALVAGSANLLNLLDLRPGRALKVGLAAALLLGLPGPATAAAVLLPGDLGEQTMLGDTGANGFGALLGLALAARCDRIQAAGALALLCGLTAASEFVSYSRVIEAVRPLRWLDHLGRTA